MAVFILGIGSATAQHSISSQRLKELGAVIDPHAPSSRTSIVSEAALFSSPKDRLLNASENTSTIGKQAVERACADAGISLESVGLIVGDGATPIQVTPSEGQRIACALQLKTPSFDIVGAGIANILHIDTARRWKEEKLPQYSVFVSSNAPTHAVDFHHSESSLFSDGASAVVVSNSKNGKSAFRVVDSQVHDDFSRVSDLKIEKLGGIVFAPNLIQEVVIPRNESVLEMISKSKKDLISQSYLLLNPLGADALKTKAIEIGFAAQNIFCMDQHQGDMLGASSFFCLDTFKNQIPSQAPVFLIAGGIGSGYGYLQLIKEES